jgi:hypothetical protein
MDRERLREMIDACRPESADLALPELAEARAELERDAVLRRQARRAEQFDRTIAASMQDVAVPAGLQDRLMAALAAGAPSAVATPDDSIVTAADNGRESRWRIPVATGIALLATAAVLLLSLTVRWFNTGDDWKPKVIADAAVQLFSSEFNPREQQLWTGGKAASAAFPLSRHLSAGRNPPQCAVRNVAGCSGMAYLLQGRAGALGTLLVLTPRATLSSFPTKPPKSPQVDTAGCAAASWQENDRLYVLVVAGGAKEYTSFLQRPGRVAQVNTSGALTVAMVR